MMLALFAFAASTAVVAQTNPDSDSTLREYEGTVEPIQKFVFSARFDGLLSKVNFTPGQIVKEGELVLQFSPASKKLGLETSRAQRRRAEAELRGAENTLRRYQELGRTDAISRAKIEDAEVARDIAAAKLEEAQSSEKIAELILKHMELRAPFSGIMSSPLVPVGTFIDLQSRTRRPLAEIVQLDPIWVVGEVPYDVFFERRMAAKDEKAAIQRARVTLVLPNGEVYPDAGRSTFAGYEVNRDTQTIKLWAEFPNPDYLLRPGLKVKIQSRTREKQ